MTDGDDDAEAARHVADAIDEVGVERLSELLTGAFRDHLGDADDEAGE